MKNIHVLPTDKPSRLQKFINYDADKIEFELCSKAEFFNKGQHIYITNDEEIKEEDFYLYCNQVTKRFRKNTRAEYPYPNYQKIILTTDQDLIKDGVQEIDNEFLEWFVKNPTCEYAHIGFIAHNDIREYKIIIPQEEPKTGSLLESIQEVTKDLLREINELKQETLEEIPKELEPILAKISHINDLGLSQWYEVVYYADDKWCSYSDSKTFEDGERVIDWKYCKEQFKNK